jgi:hypothetical protein
MSLSGPYGFSQTIGATVSETTAADAVADANAAAAAANAAAAAHAAALAAALKAGHAPLTKAEFDATRRLRRGKSKSKFQRRGKSVKRQRRY